MPKALASLVHVVVLGLAWIIPFVLASHSPMLDVTISGVLTFVYTHFVTPRL